MTQKKLTLKQTSWQKLLSKFDLALKYKLGYTNAVVDALSHKAELATLTQGQQNVFQLKSTLLDHVREGLKTDPQAKVLWPLVEKSLSQSVMATSRERQNT